MEFFEYFSLSSFIYLFILNTVSQEGNVDIYATGI